MNTFTPHIQSMNSTQTIPADLQDFVIRTNQDLQKSSFLAQERVMLIFLSMLLQMKGLLPEDEYISVNGLAEHIANLPNEGKAGPQFKSDIETVLATFSQRPVLSEKIALFSEVQAFESASLKHDLPIVFGKNVAELLRSSNHPSEFQMINRSFADFMVNFAGVKQGDSVHIAFDRAAEFCAALPEGVLYDSSVLNDATRSLALLKLHIYGKDTGLMRSVSLKSVISEKQNYDVVLSVPPVGVRVEKVTTEQGFSIKNFEEAVLAMAFSKLKASGKLLTIVGAHILNTNKLNADLRKKIIDEDLLDTVILLPSGPLSDYVSIGSVMLLLNKNKTSKNVVRFISSEGFDKQSESSRKRRKFSSELFEEYLITLNRAFYIDVPRKDIKNVGYSFNPNTYLLKRYQKEVDGVPLAEIARRHKGITKHGIESGHLVNISDLKRDKIKASLGWEEVGETELPKSSRLLEGNVLLIAKSAGGFGAKFVNSSKVLKMFAGSSIASFKVDESIADSEYLIAELNKPTVLQQVSMMERGGVIKFLTDKDIESLVIQLPPLEEQRAKVKGYKEAVLEQKKEEVEQFKKIHRLETELKFQNSYLRHTLAGPVSNLKSSIEKVTHIMNEQVFNLHPRLKDMKISEKHPFGLEDYLKMMLRDVEQVHSLVKRQLKGDGIFDEYPKSLINIIDFIERYVDEKKHSGIEYELILNSNISGIDEGKKSEPLKKLYIEGNEDVLRILFDNILENAEKHGFVYSNYKKVKIDIFAGLNDLSSITMGVSNSGKRLPPGFDCETLWKKGYSYGANGGTGMGGWYISEAIDFHDIMTEFVDETSGEDYHESDFVTTIDLDFDIFEIKK